MQGALQQQIACSIPPTATQQIENAQKCLSEALRLIKLIR
jgi:hypothetical protein